MKTFLTNIYTHDSGHHSEVDFICEVNLIDCHKPQMYVRNVEDILSLTIVTSERIINVPPSTSKYWCVFSTPLTIEEISSIEYIGVNTVTSSIELEYINDNI